VSDTSGKHALIIGASKNLGLGLVREFAHRGWEVTGTVRGTARTGLHELADESGGRVKIATADITSPADIARLRAAFADGSLDLLFINAGITDPDLPVGEVSAGVFSTVMLTNAYAPMQVIEALAPLVKDDGTIGVMSSRQGSVSLNTRGGHEVYRASKSALNQLMRSYAARQRSDRTLLLIHPGWVQTELGGAGAQLTVEQSVPGIVDVIETRAGEPGLQFRSYLGEVVPW
jgi:NAD(P)-dependent dehydrogenase (short-subunit alcohol dehydrogenase family)